ncbi:MAG: TIGR02444 family protein [Alcanivorax sp.]|nr:TIGR02444 family protein [Alcanivorax sp.]
MSDDDLWRYALGRWQQPAFERCCLRLQDQFSVPVSLLLTGLWLVDSGKQPDAAVGRRLAALAEQFEQDYLRPLRGVRRQAATDARFPEFQRQVQQVELEGERWLLKALETQCANLLPAPGQVDPLAWLLVLIPEMAQCQGLQADLSELLSL